MANKTQVNKARVTRVGDNHHSYIIESVEVVPAVTRMTWEDIRAMSERGLTEREAAEMQRQLQAHILEATMGMYLGAAPRPEPARHAPGLTLAGVMSMYDHFMAQPLTIIEIWFVDRPHEFWRTYELELRRRPMLPRGRSRPELAGIPLYEWYNARQSANDRRPPFADEPGVYIVLSNGGYQRISQ